jgi:hypothetical protein
MLMDKMEEIMVKYLTTVTTEQFKKDIEIAGISECPDNVSFDVIAEPTKAFTEKVDFKQVNVISLKSTYVTECKFYKSQAANFTVKDLRKNGQAA